VTLLDEVECDEAYVIAGHKGQPEVVKKKGRKGRRRRLKGKAGRGTLEKERPPVFGMMQRGGQVVINLLANMKQKTIEPFIKDTIVPGALVYWTLAFLAVLRWLTQQAIQDRKIITQFGRFLAGRL
jgi:ISXO2-like transposase domain